MSGETRSSIQQAAQIKALKEALRPLVEEIHITDHGDGVYHTIRLRLKKPLEVAVIDLSKEDDTANLSLDSED
jgi:hypothetical protein